MSYKTAEWIDEETKIQFLKFTPTNKTFALSWIAGDGKWYHQWLLLHLRTPTAARQYLPAAARLYRRVKREGHLYSTDSFRSLAC